jgi:hypothetical protein
LLSSSPVGFRAEFEDAGARKFMIVVLPAPDAPMIAVDVPGRKQPDGPRMIVLRRRAFRAPPRDLGVKGSTARTSARAWARPRARGRRSRAVSFQRSAAMVFALRECSDSGKAGHLRELLVVPEGRLLDAGRAVARLCVWAARDRACFVRRLRRASSCRAVGLPMHGGSGAGYRTAALAASRILV